MNEKYRDMLKNKKLAGFTEDENEEDNTDNDGPVIVPGRV